MLLLLNSVRANVEKGDEIYVKYIFSNLMRIAKRNGWAIKNVTFCILTISHSFFILMNYFFFSKYSPLKAVQNALFLLSKIISIILRYVIQSISPRRTTFKDNLLTNLSNRSFHLDDESIFRRDLIPINSMSKFIPD